VPPFQVSPTTNDPVASELQRLGVGLGPLSPALMAGRQQVPLTREDRQAVQSLRGEARYEIVRRIVESPGYQQLDDEQRRRVIETGNAEAGTVAADEARRQYQRDGHVRSELLRRMGANGGR
jgi:hypothetical protein